MTSLYRRAAFLILVLAAMFGALSAAPAASDRPLEFDHAATDEKVVALTFDGDMTPGMVSELKNKRVSSWYNEKVIEVLRQEQVPATLFLTGMWIEIYSAATKELSADPLFELGNHSYSHGAFHSPCYRLFPIPEARQATEVQKTDDLLKLYAASYKKYFRFPGLCFDAASVRKVEEQGYTAIGGDVDGADAFEKNPKWVSSSVVTRVRPGSIVVLHLQGGPNAPATASALPDIIKTLRSQGYTFVKVSDLLKLPPGAPVKHITALRQTTPEAASTPAFAPFSHLFRR
jgi:peptidoglycan/xylan/chitin deacetylase (PgdA/CDA1 family)